MITDGSSRLPFSLVNTLGLSLQAKTIVFRKAKTPIYRKGDQADTVYLLTKGTVQISDLLLNGNRQIVAFYWPGDWFGLEQDSYFSNNAETVTPCTVLQFSAARLRAFLLEKPVLQQKIFMQAIYKLQDTQKRIIAMRRFEAHHAVAAFLLDCTAYSCFNAGDNTLNLPMTRYDIADYLGLATETIVRVFGQLEDDGLIHRLSSRKLALNMSKLQSYRNIA